LGLLTIWPSFRTRFAYGYSRSFPSGTPEAVFWPTACACFAQPVEGPLSLSSHCLSLLPISGETPTQTEDRQPLHTSSITAAHRFFQRLTFRLDRAVSYARKPISLRISALVMACSMPASSDGALGKTRIPL